MKVFITGGSGFLGINLIRYLMDLGHKIVSYDLLPFDYPEKDKVKSVIGDIRDLNSAKEAMKGCDAIVHCAAALPLYKPKDIYTTDVIGTRRVLEGATRNGIKRVVHISSTAVYGVPDHHPLYEDDPLIGVGPYGKAKILAEEECLKYRKKGLCVPIIRPKSFVGPERLGVFAMLYDWAADGHGFPIIGSGDNLYQYLDVEDLCHGISLCLEKPDKLVNDNFNMGAEIYGTFKQDFQAVLDFAGFGAKIRAFPAGPVIFGLRILEKLKLSPLYKWVYETACQESFVSIEKAKNQLGFQPKYSNSQALIRNFQWYLENRSNFSKDSGITHRVPWKQGILGLIKHLF